MGRADLGAVETNVEQAFVAAPEQAGQRHAVDGAGVAGFRGVAVEVGIDPEQADRPAHGTGNATPGADGNGMIATDHDGKLVRIDGQCHFVGEISAQTGDSPGDRGAFHFRCKQGLAPVDQRVMFEFMPGLRSMKSNRPVFAGTILRTDAAGGTHDANALGRAMMARFHAPIAVSR